jgi:hypothetical protein
MSTDYCLKVFAPISEIFDGRLSQYGIHERVEEGRTSERERCLSDGFDRIWLSGHKIPERGAITPYSHYDSPVILGRLSQLFETAVYSEHEPQYWGFDSQQEWDEFEREMADQQYQDTYRNLINFLTLRDYPFKEGTVGMGWALTAHQLVVGDPSYLEYGRKKEFMSAVCGWD